ncbi:MAG TPA: hypothetical protein VHS06_08270 [Chloroflexota bacterium]|nr:hypothetical protein [Chloroflexota bacterium]
MVAVGAAVVVVVVPPHAAREASRDTRSNNAIKMNTDLFTVYSFLSTLEIQ